MQGDPGDALYVIASGQVDVAVRAPGEVESVINRQQAGEYFGEMALLTDAPRSATVRAVTETTVLQLGRKAFSDLLQKQPGMASTIIGTISERLRRADSAVVSTNGALTSVLDQVLQGFAGERRTRLLQAALLENPSLPAVRAVFGLDTHEVWPDLVQSGAIAGEKPVPRVLALLRQRLLAEVGPEHVALLASGMVSALVDDRRWEPALELLAEHGPRTRFVEVLARALRDVPAPDAGQMSRWLTRLTDEEAAQDVDLALARIDHYREQDNAAAAAGLIERIQSQNSPLRRCSASGRGCGPHPATSDHVRPRIVAHNYVIWLLSRSG